MDIEKEMQQKMRPFLPIKRVFDNEFISLVTELIFLIRSYGIDKVGFSNIKKDYKLFISAVHDGWKKAQIKISHNVINKLSEIESLEIKKKEFHRQKNKDAKQECINKINTLKSEILILRRFIDSIVWTILEDEHSTIRRLPLDDNLDNLSIKNLKEAIQTLEEINSNPFTIGISSDLTTFIHTGDLLVRNYFDGTLSIVELKTGKKNLEFCDAANFSLHSDCPIFDEQYTKELSPVDLKHYQRTKKQLQHMKDVTNTINTGEGYDHFHKKTVKIQDNNYIPNYFSEKIMDSWRRISLGKLWDIHVIDECLFIGTYKNVEMGFVGFNSWMKVSKFNGTVLNINDSFKLKLTKPLLNLNLPNETIKDILLGEFIVVLCLDTEKFYNEANKIHPGILKRKRVTNSKLNTMDLVTINEEAIYSENNGQEIYLGTGFLSRIIFDFQRPKNIINWIYKDSDVKRRDNREKNKKKKITQNAKKSKSKIAKLSRRKQN
ncbi:TPA: hypothetical protein ACJ5A2_002082 [Klebsiella pneumoniae]|uniref:hypothetical protein n=1 Tax=Klebsiella pneumoniae TaxID=573 RepID=UPI0013D46748|nr:hypothetical protein [Klebsiella pneumoniae]MBO8099183.1 hypothetical protein [Klebsiella pneumoniae]NGF38993.1 hypothetical protein [Klebsiella pneumoniae]HDV0211033.1 hypothetical protein [Klebsiella pneumoniae]